MSRHNGLSADALATLEVGDTVTALIWRSGWMHPEISTGEVIRLTKTQVVVEQRSSRGPHEERYRRDDGRRVGDSGAGSRGELIDPRHPASIRQITEANRRKRQSAIDSLSYQWARKRDDLDLLRRLHVAVGEYLDAES